MYSFNSKNFDCSLEAITYLLGTKWRSHILWHLTKEKLRFSQLRDLIPKISKKALSEQLRILEKEDLIKRTVYHTVPPSVEYEATKKGQSLESILDELIVWSKENLES